jgi:di/tricarboxylate transporter
MTAEQLLATGLMIGVVGLLVWDRVRYDIVALLALLVAVLLGLVPQEKAFDGFKDEILVVVGSALVVSAAISRSGIVETAIRPLLPRLGGAGSQIAVLAGGVALLSAFMKNIGALAIFLPLSLQLARRTGTSPSCLLMPMAFASLLGGLVTQIGTSPNIIVSRVRQELTGQPFAMFDYAPVGAGLAIAGLLFLIVAWRLVPTARAGARQGSDAFLVDNYTSEMHLPAHAPWVGRTVGELEALASDEASVTGVVRHGHLRYTPESHWTLQDDDVLIVEGDAPALQRVADGAGLALVGAPQRSSEVEGERVEAVVMGGSLLVGLSPRELRLRERFGVSILALSRRGERLAARLRQVRLQEGDLLFLQLAPDRQQDVLRELGCLPLAERRVPLGTRTRAWLPVGILALAMAAVAAKLVPVGLGFLAAAVGMVLTRSLSVRDAYEAVEWPILVLLGALIPVSGTLESTGMTTVIAHGLAGLSAGLPAWGCVALVMAAAMAVTPFLNNAATVLVMAPIGAGLASQLGYSVDAFLMAVAVGAACDFLTPIGHQCNTLVMGPGGYRFGDYWRLGLPLSLLVLVLGTALIVSVWSVAPA